MAAPEKRTGYPEQIIPGNKFVPVIKADADLTNGACRALWVGTAGTANLTEVDGTERTGVPLQAGLFPCKVLQVRLGGTADNIWALY